MKKLPVYVNPRCPEGVPADEWLLAQAMTHTQEYGRECALAYLGCHGWWMADHGSNASAFFEGFMGECTDEGNPDAYAAGAAFATAHGE